jgi:hypothetical protein
MPNLSPPPNVNIPTTGPPPVSVPAERIVEPLLDVSRRSSRAKADDPFPDYDTEPVTQYANE